MAEWLTYPEVGERLNISTEAVRIPTQAGRGYRFEAGQGSDLMPATRAG